MNCRRAFELKVNEVIENFESNRNLYLFFLSRELGMQHEFLSKQQHYFSSLDKIIWKVTSLSYHDRP